MSKQATPALIGSFVLGGAALLIAFILIIAGDSFLKEERTYVVYFEGSVYGLGIGSSVMFRGVPIGYVSNIEVIGDFETLEFSVLVYININESTIKEINQDSSRLTDKLDDDVQALIDFGLRASLSSESLITGKLYVELDFRPDTEIVYRGVAANEILEIPSVPSGIQEVVANAQLFIADIQKNLDIPKVTAHLSNILAGLDTLVNADSTQVMSSEVNQTLAELRGAVRDLSAVVDGTGESIKPIASSLTAALESAEKVLQNAEQQLEQDSQLAYRLDETLREVENAARAIRSLADQLDEQPESLLKGKQ
jgi:paraquat-inducible protein B